MSVGPRRKSAFLRRISPIVFSFSARYFSYLVALVLPGAFRLSPSLYNNKTASAITSARNSTAFKIIGIAASNVAGALLVR